MSRQVVIAAFRSAAEAEQAQTVLEQNGIDAAAAPRDSSLERLCADVFDDGFDVVVDEQEATEAIAIVQRLWHDDPIDILPPPACPECGSHAVASIPRLIVFLAAAAVLYPIGLLVHQADLFSLVIAVAGMVLLIAPNRRCRDCGARWTMARP